MKRTITLLFILLFGTISLFAQEEKWRILSPPDEEFTVEFPLEKFEAYKNESYKFISGAYRAFTENTYFFIFSGHDKDNLPLDAVTNFAAENKADEEKFAVGNYNGKKYTFKDSEDFYHSLITLKADKRFYIFHAVSEIKDPDPVKKFLNSIQINKTVQTKNPSDTAAKSENQKSKAETEKAADKTESTRLPSGFGAGRGGSGDGAGSGDGSPPQTPTKPGQTSPMKILSKQQAKYTDLARAYNIVGSVMLKVTFLANGTVGAITPVSRLPFGLTTAAITAAKSVRFEPAMKNGAAVTVSRTVLFTFTIY